MRHFYAKLNNKTLVFCDKDERDIACKKIGAIPCKASEARVSGVNYLSGKVYAGRNSFIVAKELGVSHMFASWLLMDGEKKAIALRLAIEHGYPARDAINSAYIFGGDAFPFDFRSRRENHKSRMVGTY